MSVTSSPTFVYHVTRHRIKSSIAFNLFDAHFHCDVYGPDLVCSNFCFVGYHQLHNSCAKQLQSHRMQLAHLICFGDVIVVVNQILVRL